MRLVRAAAIIVGCGFTFSGLTACAPPPTFLVNATTGLADANPGDGLCQTSTPGQCTIEAAIDEGNALGAAEITVPAGSYGPTKTISGDIAINRGVPAAVFFGGTLTVAVGGNLWIEGVGSDGGFSNFVVRGELTMIRGVVINLGTAVLVHSGGTASFVNSWLYAGGGSPALDNSGTVDALFSSFYGAFNSPAVKTNSVGGTRVTASVMATNGATVCTNAWPTSGGANFASDLSCNIAGTGDQQGVDPEITPAVSITGRPVYTISSTSPLIDTVVPGVHGCGGAVAVDNSGVARPRDGNGDTIARCDKGAVERP